MVSLGNPGDRAASPLFDAICGVLERPAAETLTVIDSTLDDLKALRVQLVETERAYTAAYRDLLSVNGREHEVGA